MIGLPITGSARMCYVYPLQDQLVCFNLRILAHRKCMCANKIVDMHVIEWGTLSDTKLQQN